MSELKINECGAYERELDENWAAAYAKRLREELEIKHDKDINGVDASLRSLDGEVSKRARRTELEDEAKARADADKALGELIADLTGDIHSLPVLTLATDEETKQGAIISKAVSPHGLSETLSDWFEADIDSGDFVIPRLSFGSIVGSTVLTKLMGLELSDGKAREDIAALQEAISSLSGAVISTDEPGQTFDGKVLPVGTIYIRIDPLSIGTPIVTEIYICTSDTIMGAQDGNAWTRIYPQGGGSEIADGSVTTEKIHDNAVTESKIANNSITADMVKDNELSLDNLITHAKNAVLSGGRFCVCSTNVLSSRKVFTEDFDYSYKTGDKINVMFVNGLCGCNSSVYLNNVPITVDGLHYFEEDDNYWLAYERGMVTFVYDAAHTIIDAEEHTGPAWVYAGITRVPYADSAALAADVADGAVTTAKLASNAVTLDKLGSGLTEYSSTPVQVGTWAVDNTSIPIWRAAFEIDFGDIDVDTYNTILTNKKISHEDVEYIPIKNASGPACYIINGRGTLTRAVSAPALIDNIGMFDAGVFIDLSDQNLPGAQSRSGYYIYGWIEFATPAANIKTS